MLEMLVTSASSMPILAGKLLAVVLAGLVSIAVRITVGALATPAILDRIPNIGDLTISGSSLVIVPFCFVLGYLPPTILMVWRAHEQRNVERRDRRGTCDSRSPPF